MKASERARRFTTGRLHDHLQRPDDKDDKAFIAHAKKALGFDFNRVMDEAREEYQKHSRPSIAKRAANLVILSALKEIGEQKWRPDKEEKEEEKPERKIKVEPQPLPNKPKERKWTGKTIDQMINENLSKMRAK